MEIIDRKFLDVETPTCHASSIAFHKDAPVFAWFGGRREGLPDSSIYVQYKGKVKSLGKTVNVAHWNPILFTIKDELFLSYKIGEFCDRWLTYIINITDIENIKDLNKVKKQIVPAGLNFCVKTKPIVKDNLIYCGSSVETSFDWSSFCEIYSYKDGEFEYFSRSRPLTVEKKIYEFEHLLYGKIKTKTLGIIQPALWMDKDNYLHAFFRSSRGLGKIYYAVDKGIWTNPEPTCFDNPNASIDVVYIKDDKDDGDFLPHNYKIFLVHNPSDTYRYPLVLKELNENLDVIDELVIKKETEGKVRTPELSYPFLIEYNKQLHLTYTYGRSAIEYCVVKK